MKLKPIGIFFIFTVDNLMSNHAYQPYTKYPFCTFPFFWKYFYTAYHSIYKNYFIFAKAQSWYIFEINNKHSFLIISITWNIPFHRLYISRLYFSSNLKFLSMNFSIIAFENYKSSDIIYIQQKISQCRKESMQILNSSIKLFMFSFTSYIYCILRIFKFPPGGKIHMLYLHLLMLNSYYIFWLFVGSDLLI